jgi:hypothetical protein
MGNRVSSVSPFPLTLTLINNKDHAHYFMEYAEGIDFYVDTCNIDPINKRARYHLSYDITTIPEKEAVVYRAYLKEVIPRIPKRLRMDLKDVFIIPMMPTADGGMPHTRPRATICFPHMAHAQQVSTLIHELWHIHQRQFKHVWKDVFKQLGWTEWEGQLPTFLEKNRRLNPDTIDSPLWVFEQTWIPVPVFHDITRPEMKEVDIWFYNIVENYHLKQVPASIKAYFKNLPQSAYEHPRELAAYLLADHKQYQECPAFKDLIKSVGQLAILTE